MPHAGDAAVRAELLRLAADASLPAAMRGMFRAWAGERMDNLVENGSFEDEKPMPTGWFGGRMVGRRVDDAASDGKWSVSAQAIMAGFRFAPKPGKTYLVMFDARANKSSSEGKMNLRISPIRRDGKPRAHIPCYGLSVQQGAWQTFSSVVTASNESGEKADESMVFHIYGKNYEPDEKVWFDNVRVYCVD